MNITSKYSFAILAILLYLLTPINQLYGQTYRYAKQGYSMRLTLDNRSVLGRVAYAGVIGGIDPGPDSIGLEYPIGSPYEHIFGAGLWVGGKLDTAQSGISTPLTLVSTGYEGWIGPYFEFYPRSSPADSIWKVSGLGVQRPPSWDDYWGASIPTTSFSDNDHYCTYTDTSVRVAGHVPLRLKIVQSSFVWSDPYAEAVHIIEYKILNMGTKRIDSAYVGVFLEGDVGPYRGVPNYVLHNYTGYIPEVRTGFIHNPVDFGSTPVGLSMLHSSLSLDSLRYSYSWWSGPSHPNTDLDKYNRLSSGRIDSNQLVANLTDTRCLISFGPFTLRPRGPNHDTIVAVFAIVSGQNLMDMQTRADRARIIYENGGSVAVSEPGGGTPAQFALFQNYPNPFNPSTTIRFTLPRAGFARVAVYNVLGSEIATLVADELPSGAHLVRWDASGRSSGIYFYRLESGLHVETKKLILLR